MHPNAFLRASWRLELRPQVFVAMSFDAAYGARFTNIIEPAIAGLPVGAPRLTAFRVDNSRTGDSILTDIVDGIAHSRLVLADVSTSGRDGVSGVPYRNANVLYEVGIALACRRPEEILLVRDDRDRFLFDVSTVPHITIDFTQVDQARARLIEALTDRLKAQQFARDARVIAATRCLTDNEAKLLDQLVDDPPERLRGWSPGGTVLSVYEHALSRLLDKGVIEVVGRFEAGPPAYRLTVLGREVAARAKSALQTIVPDEPVVEPPQAASGAQDV